jgi:hypothetical protein
MISSQEAADRKRREKLAARNYQEVLRLNQETIETQETKIKRLEAELEKAKLYVDLRRAERDTAKEELAVTKAELEKIILDRDTWREGCIQTTEAHQKLSSIVRLALTPEEYHRYREIYGDQTKSPALAARGSGV